MAKRFDANHYRIFDYPTLTEPPSDTVREQGGAGEGDAEIAIEYIAGPDPRQEVASLYQKH